MNEIREKKERKFVTYINDYGSAKFQSGASDIIPPSKRIPDFNFMEG